MTADNQNFHAANFQNDGNTNKVKLKIRFGISTFRLQWVNLEKILHGCPLMKNQPRFPDIYNFLTTLIRILHSNQTVPSKINGWRD